MPAAKSLSAALCLLCLTLLLRAETPNGKLERNNDDKRPSDSSRELRESMTIPDEVGGKTFDEWRSDLENRYGDPYNRMQAVLALMAFGDKAAGVVPTLNRMVKYDGDAGVRAKVLWALKVVKINPADEEDTARALADAIRSDGQAVNRYEAIRAITRPEFQQVFDKSPDTRHKVISDLISRLSDTSTCELRKVCIMALAVAGKDKKNGPEESVTNALLLRIRPHDEPSKQVRLEAIIALGAMGPPHDARKLDQVLRALHEHVRSKDTDVQIWTHVSLMALEKKIDPKGVDLILEGLNHRKREIRTHAVTALGALAKLEGMEKKSSEFVKAICTLLEKKEPETMVQEAACSALANMGDKSDRVLGALLSLTKADNQKTNSVVLAACAALARLHADSPEVMAALKAVRKHKALSDQEKMVVAECIKKLEADAAKAGSKPDKGATQTPTGKPARDNDASLPPPPAQQTKVPIPETIGGKTYDDWKKDLEDEDPYVRGTAVANIILFREKAMEAVPELITKLNGRKSDVDAGVQVKVVLALKVMGINGADRENAIKALAHVIGRYDAQSIVRYEATQALIRLMADGEAAQLTPKIIDDLIRGARDRSTCELRQACIQALITSVDREKGPEPKVTDALIDRTRVQGEPSKQVRMQAIIALGSVGRPRSPAKLKEVLKALNDHYYSTDKAIRIWTHVSLMALNEEIKKKEIDIIVDCLKDPNREVRKQAVLALGAMAKKTTDHVRDICALLKDEKETMVQEAACRALARMGDKSDRVVNALIHLTEKDTQKTNEVVMAACATLAQLHVDDAEVIDALKEVQKHDALGEPEKKMVEHYVKIIQSPPPADVKAKDKRERKDDIREKDKKRGGR